MKIRTSLAKGKLSSAGEDTWKSKNDKPIRLPVRKRYSSPLIVELRNNSSLRDSTEAFGVLWLKDIPDNEEQTIHLPIWKGDFKRATSCCLDTPGEKIGSIEMNLTYWSGLSGYHAKLAAKDKNLGDVMEVLDAGNDNDDMDMNYADGDGNESDTSSDSSSNQGDASESGEDDGQRGALDSVKDYKKHRKQLHRRNRGLMQWKVCRYYHLEPPSNTNTSIRELALPSG
jgi:hypothetical protein